MIKTFEIKNDSGKPIAIAVGPKIMDTTYMHPVEEVGISGEEIEVSDGYHTMSELYEHRYALFCALCNIIDYAQPVFPFEGTFFIWKSAIHFDGTMYKGHFIAGIRLPKGEQITYHLPDKYWGHLQGITILERAPEYDGHTSKDVLERLMKI